MVYVTCTLIVSETYESSTIFMNQWHYNMTIQVKLCEPPEEGTNYKKVSTDIEHM